MQHDKDVYAGGLLTLVGAAFTWGATKYAVGSSVHMGPGFFPLVLGALLTGLGLIIWVRGLRRKNKQPIQTWAWKPLFFILASNFLFGVLLGGVPYLGVPAMGFIAAIFGLVLLSGLASECFNLKESLALSVTLAIGSYCLFVLILQLPFDAYPAI